MSASATMLLWVLAAPAAPGSPTAAPVVDPPVAAPTPAAVPAAAKAPAVQRRRRCPEDRPVNGPRAAEYDRAKDDMAGGRDGQAKERLGKVLNPGLPEGATPCFDDVTVGAEALLDVLGRQTVHDRGSADFRLSDGYRKREGREMAWLYVGAIAFGLFTDLFLHITFDIDASAQTAGGLGILTTGGAVAGVYLLDRGEGMRWGVPSGQMAGAMSGLIAGGYGIGTWNAIASQSNELGGDRSVQLMWGLGAAGAIGGGLAATALEMTPGQATLFPVLQIWVSLVALGVMGTVTAQDDLADERISTAGLIGGFAGLGAAGYMVASGVEPDDGRLGYINLGGVSGFVTGLLLMLTFDIEDRRPAFALLTATSATGLGLATWLTDDMHESKGRWAPWIDPTGRGAGIAGTW